VLTRKFLIVAKHDFYLHDVLEAATKSQHKFLTGKTMDDLLSTIKHHPDIELIFFPHFSEIIPESVFSQFTCIGFHTGNLPLDKGGSPIQHQILNGAYSTKVSAIKIVQSIDAGPLYSQKDFDLSSGSISQILRGLSKIVTEMVFELISDLPDPRPQIGESSVHKRLTGADAKIELEKLSNRQIFDRIRMVDGLDYPKAFTEIGDVKLILSDAEFVGNRVSFRATIEE